MADTRIMKAVEFSKLPVKFRKQHKDEQALYDAGWVLHPKYDGCYAEFHVDNRPRNGQVTALTRTGHPILSCAHIGDALSGMTPPGTQCVYAGELWSKHPDVLFPQISGEVRRHSAAPGLEFMAFDLLPPGLETTEQYAFRHFHLMQRFLNARQRGNVDVVPFSVKGQSGVHAYARRLKATGKYDGAILRNPRAGYTIGLVKEGEIVKVKPVMSLDLLVTQVLVAPGAKTGRPVYTIEVNYNGVLSMVGSGVPHKRDSVPNVGDIAEIECMDVTEDGKLREPRFKGIRFDKDKPD